MKNIPNNFEQKSNPESRRIVEKDLERLFATLKEHLANLTSEDVGLLSKRFTSEAFTYFRSLLERLENSKK